MHNLQPVPSGTSNRLVIGAILVLVLCLQGSLTFAAGLPCRPCSGLRVVDPMDWIDQLEAAPALSEEARLYISWPAELAATDLTARAIEAVTQSGARPWPTLIFRTPAPLASHLDALELELGQLAAIARRANEKTHFQILWQPAASKDDFDIVGYGFLLKRAAVTITGAQPQALVISQPLALDVDRLALLYQQEIAAYLDGVALQSGPRGALEKSLAKLTELDPGKLVVFDAAPYPNPGYLALPVAAEHSTIGFSLTMFETDDASGSSSASDTSLAPLKMLAEEFKGDLSYDPYSKPVGPAEAWSFVRGEDLSLRIILKPELQAGDLIITFPDPQLRRPAQLRTASGEFSNLFGLRLLDRGVEVTLTDPGPATILRMERLDVTETDGGVSEKLTVTTERTMPVEEILRRLQAVEDDQARRLKNYQALNTTHLRFQAGTNAQSVETTFKGPYFFEQGKGFDWVWQEFFINGIKWKKKTIPEIPIIQPEKATSVPIEISFTEDYSYTLRGTGTVEGRDCWVIDFKPLEAVEEGESLYQGTVWVDRRIYARVRTRAIQLGLRGEVLSSEETTTFSPIDANGQPGPWETTSYFLPTKLIGQQLWSVLSFTTPVEREISLTEIEVNLADFEERREVMLQSDYTMVRDTDEGLRYLVLDKETGERVVKEGFDLNRKFLVGGVYYDEALDFPIPLAGVNWVWFDWLEKGLQADLFFAGPLVIFAATDPDFRGSRFDLGMDAFVLAIRGSDTLFRDGAEVNTQEVKFRNPFVDFKIGHPIGNFFKLNFRYRLLFAEFAKAKDTAEDFVLPTDHLSHDFTLIGRYNRKGYRFRAIGSHIIRSKWEPWGLPGSNDFEVGDDQYNLWTAAVGKTWHFPRFLKFGMELEYVGGSHLDRFSKYEFGFFSDIRIHGYQTAKVRAEEAFAAHLTYGFDVGQLFRLDLVGDAAWATDSDNGLDREFLAGLGIAGTVLGPKSTVINIDLGKAVAGPDDSFSVFVAVLKLFD